MSAPHPPPPPIEIPLSLDGASFPAYFYTRTYGRLHTVGNNIESLSCTPVQDKFNQVKKIHNMLTITSSRLDTTIITIPVHGITNNCFE